MLRGMSAKQLEEWKMFDAVEPFGPERTEQSIASVVQVLLNVNRDKKKKRDPFTIDDCVMEFGDARQTRKRKTTNWKALKATALAVAAQQNRGD